MVSHTQHLTNQFALTTNSKCKRPKYFAPKLVASSKTTLCDVLDKCLFVAFPFRTFSAALLTRTRLLQMRHVDREAALEPL